MLNNQYDFDDFLTQTKMISKLGPMGNLMKMMPSQFTGGVTMSDSDSQKAEAQLKRFKSMVYSMTPAERRTPALVQASRTRAERIAKGSGRKLDDVAELLQSHGTVLYSPVLHARVWLTHQRPRSDDAADDGQVWGCDEEWQDARHGLHDGRRPGAGGRGDDAAARRAQGARRGRAGASDGAE
jgi:hypothetical protein